MPRPGIDLEPTRIAIVGSGPAGLAAAWSLSRFEHFEVEVWTASTHDDDVPAGRAADLTTGPLAVAPCWWSALGLEPELQTVDVAPPGRRELAQLRRWRRLAPALATGHASLSASLRLTGVDDTAAEWIIGLVSVIAGHPAAPDDLPLSTGLTHLRRLDLDPLTGDRIALDLLLGPAHHHSLVRRHLADQIAVRDGRRVASIDIRARAPLSRSRQRRLAVSDPAAQGPTIHIRAETGERLEAEHVILALEPASARGLLVRHPLSEFVPATARIQRLLAEPAQRVEPKLTDPTLRWDRSPDGCWTHELRSGEGSLMERVVLGAAGPVLKYGDVDVSTLVRPSPLSALSGPAGSKWRQAQGRQGLLLTAPWAVSHDLDTQVAAGFAVADRLGAPWPFRSSGAADRWFGTVFDLLHGAEHRAWRRAVTVPHTSPTMKRPPAWTPHNPATTA